MTLFADSCSLVEQSRHHSKTLGASVGLGLSGTDCLATNVRAPSRLQQHSKRGCNIPRPPLSSFANLGRPSLVSDTPQAGLAHDIEVPQFAIVLLPPIIQVHILQAQADAKAISPPHYFPFSTDPKQVSATNALEGITCTTPRQICVRDISFPFSQPLITNPSILPPDISVSASFYPKRDHSASADDRQMRFSSIVNQLSRTKPHDFCSMMRFRSDLLRYTSPSHSPCILSTLFFFTSRPVLRLPSNLRPNSLWH